MRWAGPPLCLPVRVHACNALGKKRGPGTGLKVQEGQVPSREALVFLILVT